MEYIWGNLANNQASQMRHKAASFLLLKRFLKTSLLSISIKNLDKM